MKKFFVLFISLLLVGMFVGCDETTETGSNQAVPLQKFEETATLQGTVFDAVTGARIGDSTLKVTLVKGSTYASPAVLKNSSTDTTFLGDFAFNDVPVTQGGVATYRIVAEMTGYQTFEGYVNLNVDLVAGVTSGDIIDDVYNYIANIYMFPVGSYSTAQTVYVYYDNEPVSGATVLFELQPATGGVTTATTVAVGGIATVQPAANGLNSALSGTTDATGMVTFAAANLVLGGSYTVNVLPITYEGVQLAFNGAAPMVVGTAPNVQVVNMVDEVPGGQSDGLYVVSVSPTDPQDVVSSGVMTITFNRAIALVSEDAFTAALSSYGGPAAINAVLDNATAGDEVAARVSSDGLVLTLTPKFTTDPVAYDGTNGSAGTAAADIGLRITYTGGQITLEGDDTSNAMAILTGGDDVLTIGDASVTRNVNLTSLLDD